MHTREWDISTLASYTACGRRMAHRKWKETKLQPGTAGPGNMLGCSLASFLFLWAILCPQAVHPPIGMVEVNLEHYNCFHFGVKYTQFPGIRISREMSHQNQKGALVIDLRATPLSPQVKTGCSVVGCMSSRGQRLHLPKGAGSTELVSVKIMFWSFTEKNIENPHVRRGSVKLI